MLLALRARALPESIAEARERALAVLFFFCPEKNNKIFPIFPRFFFAVRFWEKFSPPRFPHGKKVLFPNPRALALFLALPPPSLLCSGGKFSLFRPSPATIADSLSLRSFRSHRDSPSNSSLFPFFLTPLHTKLALTSLDFSRRRFFLTAGSSRSCSSLSRALPLSFSGDDDCLPACLY